MLKVVTIFRIILFAFLVFLMSCTTNNIELVQDISYLGVEYKIPSNWNYKSQELENALAHQIS